MTRLFTYRTLAVALAACTVLTMLTACGARIVRGESPFVQINGLKLDNRTLSLDLGVRNVNEVLMEIEHMDFVLRIRDSDLAEFDAPRQTSVIANGSETLRFELPVSRTGHDLLMRLQNGATESLPYSLEGSIRAMGESVLVFKGRGHIYPVPGRPGQFR